MLRIIVSALVILAMPACAATKVADPSRQSELSAAHDAANAAADAAVAAAMAAQAAGPPTRLVGRRVGLLCIAAIYHHIDELGRRCFSGKDVDFQSELVRSLAEVDAAILRDSNWTLVRLDQFIRQQSGAENPTLCEGDATVFYSSAASAGPEALRVATKELLSRPLRPEWGDCI